MQAHGICPFLNRDGGVDGDGEMRKGREGGEEEGETGWCVKQMKKMLFKYN